MEKPTPFMQSIIDGNRLRPSLCYNLDDAFGREAIEVKEVLGRVDNYPFIRTPSASKNHSFWAAFPERDDVVFTLCCMEGEDAYTLYLWVTDAAEFKKAVKEDRELNVHDIIDRVVVDSISDLLTPMRQMLERAS